MTLDLSILDEVAKVSAVVSPTVAPVEGLVAHVDGDMIAYMAGGNEGTSIATSRDMMTAKLGRIMRSSGATVIVMHLTASGCLKGNRVLYAETVPYQVHRKKKSKPKNYQYLRDYMETYSGPLFVPKVWHDREADDGMAMAGGVIATADKDLLATPGWHYDWDTGEMVFVPEGTYYMPHSNPAKCYGYKWFLMQMLMGDDADAIPGLGKGYGAAYAIKALEGTTTAAEGCMKVIGEYTKRYGLDDAAMKLAEMATLLWIRRGKEAKDAEWYEHWPVKHNRLETAIEAHAERVQRLLDEANAIMNMSPTPTNDHTKESL